MVKILALGDVSLKTKDNSNPFLKIEPLFHNVDFVILNLETVIAKEEKTYHFKEKSVILYVYSQSLPWLLQYKDKFIFTLANNHIYDLGEDGYKDTLTFLQKNNFMFVPPDKSFVVKKTEPMLKIDAVYSGIKNIHHKKIVNNGYCKSDGIINILSIHWGEENILLPSLKQIELSKSLHKKGVDIILGHHSHTPQGCLLKENKLSVFSLGNCNMPYGEKQKRLYRIGLIYEISISKDKNILYRKLPIEMDGNYKPVELKSETVMFLLDKLDKIVDIKKSPSAKLNYIFRYYSHLSEIYIINNFLYGWLPRIRKYGIKYFIMMLRWFFSKIFILSLLHLPFYHFVATTRIMKRIND